MVCSSNSVFEDFSLSCNGTLPIQQSKPPPPLNNNHLKKLLSVSEKLSWSQTKVLKMSKPGSAWDNQRKSWANQRHQLFATLLDDDVPPEDEMKQNEDKDIEEEVSIIGYNKKDTTSIYQQKDTTSIYQQKDTTSIYQQKDTTSIYQQKDTTSIYQQKDTTSIYQQKDTTSIYQPVSQGNTTSIYQPVSQGTNLYSTMPQGGILRNTVESSNIIKNPNVPVMNPTNVSIYNNTTIPQGGILRNMACSTNMIKYQNIPYNNSTNSVPQGGILRNTIGAPNTINFQTIPYKNSTSEAHKIQYAWNNGYSHNIIYPKKVTFQEPRNDTKVENKNMKEVNYIKKDNVNNESVYSKPNTVITSQDCKMQLAEHLRAKRISEAIEAAITSKCVRPHQSNQINKDQNSDKSNWSISQKLDYKTNEIMPLTLKLKKETKKRGRKRTKRCDTNSDCPTNCVGCKKSHTDAVKKKKSKNPETKNLSFLDLPEDGNYYITRKAIEECPMCYTPLNIRSCVVNITLLTYTYYCECGVTIFHIPQTPDNIPHPIKIIETLD